MSNQLSSHEGVYTKTSGPVEQLDVNALANQYMKHDGLVILWSVHEVKWGYYASGAFRFSDGSTSIEPSYLQELRIFNETEELRLTVDNYKPYYRYISDETGESVSYVDSTSRLIGENVPSNRSTDQIEGFTHLVDGGRKLSQIVPIVTNKQYCYLTTRNYIGYLDNNQASYTDYRYVAVVDKEV